MSDDQDRVNSLEKADARRWSVLRAISYPTSRLIHEGSDEL